MNVCVFAGASEEVEEVYKAAAFEVGTAMAGKGLTLVFGAGKTGMMGAVCRGVLSANGSAIGIVPSFFKEEDLFSDSEIEIITTESMRQRKQIMDEKSDAVIVLPGGIGTMDEFFEVLTLKQLKRLNKPIMVLNTNGFYDKMISMLQGIIDESFAHDSIRDLFYVHEDPSSLVDALAKTLEY